MAALLEADFTAGLTAVRLALDMSKDEFEPALRAALGGAAGKKRFSGNRSAYIQALMDLGVADAFLALRARPVT